MGAVVRKNLRFQAALPAAILWVVEVWTVERANHGFGVQEGPKHFLHLRVKGTRPEQATDTFVRVFPDPRYAEPRLAINCPKMVHAGG